MTEKARVNVIATDMRKWPWSRVRRLAGRMEKSAIHRAVAYLRDRMMARIKGTRAD